MIDRAKELQKIWKDYRESRNAITPKTWKKESAELKNSQKLFNWKMEQLSDELNRAEKITKRLEELKLKGIRKSQTREVQNAKTLYFTYYGLNYKRYCCIMCCAGYLSNNEKQKIRYNAVKQI